MVALVKFPSSIPPTVPGQVPEELYQPLNDLYLAFYNLVNQLNAASPVMISPNGHYWQATISNTGTITWTDAGLVRP